MAVTYGFYDSLAGDRKYNALQMGRMFEGMVSDGVFSTVGQGLVVTPNIGTMTINVGTGRAWFNFTWTLNDSNLVLTVQPAEVALNRIDTVVVEVNSDIGVRANAIKIIKGTPAASPVAPTLANTATLHQYALADIVVNSGVTQIAAPNITNRIGTVGTPFVSGLVETINFSTLLGRFESDFVNWLADLQDELDANQAGNLQGQINALEAANKGWVEQTETWTYLSATTITVPTDATLRYERGWGVRLKQGGAYKYFYVTNVAATVLTLVSGDGTTLANAAITDRAFTRTPATAIGFPGSMPYNSPAFGGFGTSPTAVAGQFWVVGRMCTYVHFENPGVSNGSTFTVGLPIPANFNGSTVRYYGTVFSAINGGNPVTATTPSVLIAPASPTVVQLFTDAVGAAWVTTGNKQGRFQIAYPI